MTMLRITVKVSKNDFYHFCENFYELAEDADLDLDGVEVFGMNDKQTVYFLMAPEKLTDELSDLIGLNVQGFDAEINEEVEEV